MIYCGGDNSYPCLVGIGLMDNFTSIFPLVQTLKCTETLILCSTGIPRFTLLMWGHKNKTAEAKTA
jgi:hypothetical protein